MREHAPESLTMSLVAAWIGEAKAGDGNAGFIRQHVVGCDSCRLKPAFLAKGSGARGKVGVGI